MPVEARIASKVIPNEAKYIHSLSPTKALPRRAELTYINRPWPCAEVPHPEKRDSADARVKHTAGHELNHALVAYMMGVPVNMVSVVPEGNSLGRTVFGGHHSLHEMQVIAAARSVATHDGTAHGFGSDMYKVNLIHHFADGISPEAARSQAAAIISTIPHAVRNKAAEILAHMKETPGSRLSEILERARLEVEWETRQKQDFTFESPEQPEHIPEPGKYTTIDDLGHEEYRIRYIYNGIIEKEEHVCGLCQGINSHSDMCPKKPKKDHLFEPPNTIKKKETIFKYPAKEDESILSS